MRLFFLLLSLPLVAQQEQLKQLAKTFSTLTYYSATFISSQPTDVSVNGVPQRMVTRRKVLVNGRNKRMDVIFDPPSHEAMNVGIVIINDDHKWELTPSAKFVYSIRSPQLQLEPYEVMPLHRASLDRASQWLALPTLTGIPGFREAQYRRPILFLV